MTQAPQHDEVASRPCHEPVFLLAPARSYSTITLALLAGHPDIYGFPEMLLFTANTVGELLRAPPRESSHQARRVSHFKRSGILRAVADLREGSQDGLAIRRARDWLAQRSAWSPVQLMDCLLGLAAPRIGLEKSPETLASTSALDACVKSYPRARYIHLTRHPVSTQGSMHNHWRYRSYDEKVLVARAATAWYLGHLRIVRRLSRLSSQQQIRVRAEDVLREPFVWLPKILDWLGLRSDSEVIAEMIHTENWRFANTGPSGDLYGIDPGFINAPALRPIPDPGEVSFDPAWGLPAEMSKRMAELARYLGYQ